MSPDGSRPAPRATPVPRIAPLSLRGRIGRAQPKGLPVVNLGYNELPWGPTTRVAEAIAAMAGSVNSYGSPGCDSLRAALATANRLDADRLICGNGSEELLDVIGRTFAGPGDEILISAYGYIQFAMVAARVGATLVKAPERDSATDVDAMLDSVTARTRVVFLANPNNPTGTMVGLDALERLVRGLPPEVVLVLDLAYGEFAGFSHCAAVHDLARGFDNVVVTRTFSKAYGLAGLRVGWADCPPAMLPALYAARGMGSVNRMAQAAAEAALADIDEVHARVGRIVAERERLASALGGIGMTCLPSATNFLATCIDGAGPEVTEALVEHVFEDAGIVVNRTREDGLERYLRLSMGTEAQNDLLLESVGRFLAAR
jgi:histidinol-phosphate aminotransferase